MKNIRNQKGFTLIEVLIVVVIIGILAALLLPRMLQQPERARLAEANQMLGVIRRAQANTRDTTGAAGYLALVHATAGNWTRIGLQQPPNTSLFSYSCAVSSATPDADVGTGVGDSSTCTATRWGGFTGGVGQGGARVDFNGDTTNDTATININTGNMGCLSGYTPTTLPNGGTICSA